MKQVFLSGKGQVEIFDAPIPARIRDGLLVRTAFSIISAGTEGAAVTRKDGLAGLHEKLLKSRNKLDQVWDTAKTQGISNTLSLIDNKLNDHVAIGYSLAGVVADIDNTEIGFSVGDRVVGMGTGFANHAEFVCIPKNLAVKIPEGVPFEDASFGAIACIAMQGLRRLELEPGAQVGIVGLGLIGQIAFRLAACMGFRPYGFDIDQERVNLAEKSTSDLAFNSVNTDPVQVSKASTGGHGFDGVVVCASADSDALVNQVFDMCRKRGRVSIVGDIGLGLKRAKMYSKELEIRLSCSYGVGRYDEEYELMGRDYPLPYVRWTERRNLEYYLELLATSKLDVADLISGKFLVEDAKSAYAEIKSAEKSVYGVLLNYDLKDDFVMPTAPSLLTYSEIGNTLEHLSFGLVGVGAYAKNVHVPNLAKIPKAKIVGIASKSGGTAAVVAKKTNANFATSNNLELIQHSAIDAVLISTRHSSHAGLVVDALQAGKNVFVEKPMATTIEDCKAILEAQKQSGRVVRVGFNRRFSPMLKGMKNFVGAGRKLFTQRVNIGDVGQHWSNTKQEGGRLMGEGVHFFDLSNWMMDDLAESVTANFIGEPDLLNPNVSLNLGYRDGSVATIIYTTVGNTHAGKEYFELLGNARFAKVDDYKSLEMHGQGPKVKAPRKNDKGQLDALSEFVEACTAEESSEGANAIAGLWATAITEAAVESGRTGRTIRLDEFFQF